MALKLTEAAASKVKDILQAKDRPDAALRLFVQGGGCSGLEYGMTLDDPQDGDHVFEGHGVKLIVDPRSLPFVDGSNVDFEETMMGGGFKLDNPQAAGSCGCGQSFQPKQGTAGAPDGKKGGCGSH